MRNSIHSHSKLLFDYMHLFHHLNKLWYSFLPIMQTYKHTNIQTYKHTNIQTYKLHIISYLCMSTFNYIYNIIFYCFIFLQVKHGAGNTNDGNTARKFFKSDKTADILGIPPGAPSPVSRPSIYGEQPHQLCGRGVVCVEDREAVDHLNQSWVWHLPHVDLCSQTCVPRSGLHQSIWAASWYVVRECYWGQEQVQPKIPRKLCLQRQPETKCARHIYEITAHQWSLHFYG